jgi:CRISPR-associated protein Cas1
VAVIDALESGVLDLPDFYFTGDDYRYRFEPEAKQRFLDLLHGRFNSGPRYKGRMFKWDTIIEQKTAELGHYLVGRTSELNFTEPSPGFSGTDNRELRRRILSLTEQKARKLGIGKSTLHYLRKNAQKQRPLEICQKVRERLEMTPQPLS